MILIAYSGFVASSIIFLTCYHSCFHPLTMKKGEKQNLPTTKHGLKKMFTLSKCDTVRRWCTKTTKINVNNYKEAGELNTTVDEKGDEWFDLDISEVRVDNYYYSPMTWMMRVINHQSRFLKFVHIVRSFMFMGKDDMPLSNIIQVMHKNNVEFPRALEYSSVRHAISPILLAEQPWIELKEAEERVLMDTIIDLVRNWFIVFLVHITLLA